MTETVKIDDMTIFNAMSNKELFLKGLENGARIFDLSDVGEIDSTGIQLLIAASKQAKTEGVEIQFQGASEEIRQLVSQYDLSELTGITA